MRSVIERFLALFLSIILLPVFIILALVIFIDSPGPVIFRQTRIGYQRKPFTVYKFRTMFNRFWPVSCITTNDKRVTPVGRFLRKTHLDELPQLWNIFFGQMFFVGPRPQVPELAELYSILYPHRYGKRFTLLPGLTGLPQIMGEKLNTHDLFQAIALDEVYRLKRNFWLDMWIMAKTIVKVVQASSY